MAVKQNIFHNFYIKIFGLGWVVGCLVWSFMIFQFWWGNHDWDYLKKGVSLSSGFFEARYSLHLPTVLFFDGNILPVIMIIISLALFVILAILVAIYLKIPKNFKSYSVFVLSIAILPHIAVLFYYRHYILPLAFWGCLGVSLLFCTEYPYKWWKLLCGSLGLSLVFGSYPPIFCMIAVIFMGRQIIYYLELSVVKKIFYNGLFFLVQIVFAFGFYKYIKQCLENVGLVNTDMYNLSILGPKDILFRLPSELKASFFYFGKVYFDFGLAYTIFLMLLFVGALIVLFYKAKSRFIVFLLTLGLLLASRIPFLLSASAYIAYFRVSFWGELGLILVLMAILLLVPSKFIYNMFFMAGLFFAPNFILTDLEIQKVQYLSFNNERLLQKRVEERFFLHPKFTLRKKYTALHFGYPKIHQRFCHQNCKNLNKDVFNDIALPSNYIPSLFWDEIDDPVQNRLGVWDNILWFVDYSLDFKVDMSEINLIRYWMYMKAKQYPNQDGIYIDDDFILLVLDKQLFSLYQEKFMEGLLMEE